MDPGWKIVVLGRQGCCCVLHVTRTRYVYYIICDAISTAHIWPALQPDDATPYSAMIRGILVDIVFTLICIAKTLSKNTSKCSRRDLALLISPGPQAPKYHYLLLSSLSPFGPAGFSVVRKCFESRLSLPGALLFLRRIHPLVRIPPWTHFHV